MVLVNNLASVCQSLSFSASEAVSSANRMILSFHFLSSVLIPTTTLWLFPFIYLVTPSIDTLNSQDDITHPCLTSNSSMYYETFYPPFLFNTCIVISQILLFNLVTFHTLHLPLTHPTLLVIYNFSSSTNTAYTSLSFGNICSFMILILKIWCILPFSSSLNLSYFCNFLHSFS